MYLLKTMHKEFYGYGVSSMDMESGFLSGRPFGGIGVLWNKSMCNFCTIKRYDSRLLGFSVITTSGTLFILNVYLPYQCHDNYEEYCHYLGKISANNS